MKTKTIIIIALFLVGFLFQPVLAEAETIDFKKALSKTVKYPAKASENGMEGTIWVSLDVDANGIMSVNESNHNCCDKLHENVVEQLDGKKIKKFDESMVGRHNIKLVFDIQE
ncbi:MULTISPECIES: hypothetical protein [unclassified Lentimicrobium]|uniref:hypothetical protein n=1 Tax=unclassified Lentimicrobium TaxID=2677434 RepID=UPI00155608E2|nr:MULTISPECIES: hypothetical protein [unclassified Lentimicrobium]NPD47199.1 hypothetical protein [Lentimicrobium sp. S6]NPD84878.1 hypothetical protein [Lentimicrobium sp. L6]